VITILSIGIFDKQIFGEMILEKVEVPKIIIDGVLTHQTDNDNGMIVNYDASATYRNKIVDVYCKPDSGSLFTIGETTVNCNTIHSFSMPLAKQSFVVSVNRDPELQQIGIFGFSRTRL